VDFGSLVTLALIVGGVIVVRRFTFRQRALSFGRRQARALQDLARSFPDDNPGVLALDDDETFIYRTGQVSLVETRRGARRSKRTLGALTFRVAPGVYATGGGGGSVSPPPPESMTTIDSGFAVFSDKRVVFVGGMHSREWRFDKLLGATPFQGSGVLIAVSNKQKMSGVVPQVASGITPWVAFQIAQEVEDHGIEGARAELDKAATDAAAQVEFLEKNILASRAQVEKFQQQQARTPRTPSTPTPRTPSASSTHSPQTIEVVGESFHPESMKELRRYFRSSGNTEHIVEAELQRDPDNPHSPSGKAVKVLIRDMPVGHIPESLAPQVFDQINPDEPLMLGSRLWLDTPGKTPNKSSVTLFVDSRLEI